MKSSATLFAILALMAAFAYGQTVGASIRAEVFNAPNHPNFAVPSGVIAFTNAAGAVSPTWGRITSTVTTARQIQFGLKLTY